jgi:hypothetical protein
MSAFHCRVCLLAFAILAFQSHEVEAGIITGPSDSTPGNWYTNGSTSDNGGGIVFTANQNAILTGFNYFHYNTGQTTASIVLVNLTTNTTTVLASPYKPNTTGAQEYTASGLSAPLVKGDVYRLLGLGQNVSNTTDALFVYQNFPDTNAFTYPESNSDITVVGSGYFINGAFDAANPGFGNQSGDSGYNTAIWVGFTNIQTTPAPTPEPASALVLGLATLVGGVTCRRRMTS